MLKKLQFLMEFFFVAAVVTISANANSADTTRSDKNSSQEVRKEEPFLSSKVVQGRINNLSSSEYLLKSTLDQMPVLFQNGHKLFVEGEAVVVYKKERFSSPAVEMSKNLTLPAMHIKKSFGAISSTLKHAVKVIESNISTDQLIKILSKDPQVLSVSPNYIYHMRSDDLLPNDPMFDQLWGLKNTGQGIMDINGTPDADIHAAEAWQTNKGSKDVVIAVLDTGVDYAHPDLVKNMWINEAEANGTSGEDDDGNGFIDDLYGYDFSNGNDPDPKPEHYHGTHVAGTIGAEGDNGEGVTGVNHHVKIMALKVFGARGGATYADIIEAIDYAVMMKQRGVNIVAMNASLGGLGGEDGDPLYLAIQAMDQQGIILAAAAGNSALNNDGALSSYPASYHLPNIIAVAASNQDDMLTWFSNKGRAGVDIAAPGYHILSTMPSREEVSYEVISDPLFLDDIESDQDSWITSGTHNHWGITTHEANSSTHSWTDSPDGKYESNTNASLAYNKDINLSGQTDENLSVVFAIKGELENRYDKLYLEISKDSGTSWRSINSFTGKATIWRYISAVIPSGYRTENFRFRFRLSTDVNVIKDGVYIDNVMIAVTQEVIVRIGEYTYLSGTSMATPHVAGAAGLMASAYPDEGLYDRIDRILSGTDPLLTDQGKTSTNGRLNLAKSIDPNLQLRPFIFSNSDTNFTIATDGTLTLKGQHFGNENGEVSFTQQPMSSLFSDDAKPTDAFKTIKVKPDSWSDTEITVHVPENAGRFVSVFHANGAPSVNQIIAHRWQNVDTNETYFTSGGSSAVYFQDKVYAFAARDAHHYYNGVKIYDPQTQSWSDGNASSFTFPAIAKLNNKIYALDNENSQEDLRLAVYDPKTDKWDDNLSSLSTNFPHGTFVAAGSYLYYIGGSNYNGTLSNQIHRYNPEENSWQEIEGGLMQPKVRAATAVYEDKIYLFGGIEVNDEGKSVYSRSIEVYNPATNTSNILQSELPLPCVFGNAVSTELGIVLLNGIYQVNGDRALLNRIDSFSPSNGTIISYNGTVNDKNAYAYFSSAVYVPANKTIMSIGGQSYFGEYRMDRAEVIPIEFIAPNQSPLANAGEDINATEGDSVTLNGTQSSDPDGTIATYEWKEGSALLSNQAAFTKSDFSVGEHTLTLTVTDDRGATASDSVLVRITAGQPPLANAGEDINATEGDSVTLNGTQSSDPDGTIATYEWKEGSALLSNQAAFTKSDFSVGEHTLTLTVTDDRGATASDSVLVRITAGQPPLANAGEDINATEGDSVTLNGTQSSDPDGTIATYEWKEGSALLSNQAAFTKSDFSVGEHTLTLTVTDDRGATASDSVLVRITAGQPPLANAGEDINATEGDSVTLNGTQSSDPDGTIATYEWKEGSALLSNQAAFTKSDFSVGEHTLTLTVTDDRGATASDSVLVRITAGQPPLANAGEDINATEGDSVTLNGTQSSDPDGTIATYEWKEGSALLSNQAAFTKSDFSVGEHTLTLTVTDDRGATASDSVLVRITAGQPPLANAGEDINATEGDSVTLNGTQSSDPDGTIATYEWKEGSALLSNQAAFTKSDFSVGEHTLTLTVTDDRGATASDSVLVRITAGQPPLANAGEDINATEGDSVTLNGTQSSDPDGTIATYEWKEGSALLSNQAAFTKSDFSVGEHTLTLTVTDDRGATASDSVLVRITAGQSGGGCTYNPRTKGVDVMIILMMILTVLYPFRVALAGKDEEN